MTEREREGGERERGGEKKEEERGIKNICER
jgi:hypothetical protein